MSLSEITCRGIKFHTTINKILVRMDKMEKKTKSGLIIPDTVNKRTDFSGEIVAVSRGEKELEVGMRVVVTKNTKRLVPVDDTENEYNLYNTSEIKLYGI